MNNYATVQEHHEQLQANAKEVAVEETSTYIQNLNLDNLSDEKKIFTIHNELLKLKKEIDAFECPEYIHLAK